MNHADKRIQFVKHQYRAYRAINPKVLAREPELMAVKWPGYRFMTPLEATLRFARDYRAVFQRFFARDIDRDMAKNVKGIDLGKLLSDDALLADLWSARQIADRTGLPYPDYLHFCFDFASRRQRKMLPQPNQLGPSATSEFAWNAEYEKHHNDLTASGILVPPHLPELHAKNYKGLPAQNALRAEIGRKMTEMRESPARSIERYAVEYEFLPLSIIETLLEPDLFAKAMDSLHYGASWHNRGLAAAGVTLLDDVHQGCFGNPVSVDDTFQKPDVCGTCPQQAQCGTLAAEIVALAKKNGTMSWADRKRMKARERKRRQRAKSAQTTIPIAGTASNLFGRF